MRIAIFGAIGEGGVTAETVRFQLDQLSAAEPLTVEINSDGGSVSEAAAIYAMLSARTAPVTTVVVGWALSAASLILMAGQRRLAHDSSLVMVHAPWVPSISGNAGGLRQHADALDSVAASMRGAYRRTGQADAVIDSWLDGRDHWFTADQAIEVGLITEIALANEPAAVTAPAPAVAAACRHPIPQHILERIRPMTAITSASPHHPSADVQGRRAEHERQRAISASFSKFIGHEGIDQLQRQCVDDINCTPALANQRILAHLARGAESAAAFYVPSDPGADGRLATFCAAASDAILIRTGIRVAEPHPATRDVQRMSLTAIAENVLRMRGMSVTGKGPAALIKAALGTSDFPALLSNTANKALLSGYDAAPQTHALWTGEREVRDFKLNTLVALGEAPGLEQVPELGEYKQGAMAEAAESFAIAKYGKIVALSREAMINDDLAAFTKLPRAFGAAARRLEADKVYGRLTGNPVTSDGNALFSVAHGNLSASGAAPSVESLGAARAAMRKQMGVGNLDYIDPAPKYLVVPVSLETKCEQLLASLVDPSKSNDTANVQWIRGLTLVADPRLDADSETAWYLSADPAQIEGIVRVYLAGEQRPALEEDSSFDTDALAWKTRLEFAAAVVGWRALFKNPGA